MVALVFDGKSLFSEIIDKFDEFNVSIVTQVSDFTYTRSSKYTYMFLPIIT